MLRKLLEFSFLGLFFATCTLVSFVALYWLFIQPDRIMTSMNDMVTTNSPTNTFKVGETLLLSRHYCLETADYTGLVSRSFSDHIIYQMPDTTTQSNKTNVGCSDRVFATEIPLGLPSGDYDYVVRISYQINPIKKVVIDLPTVKLHIINPIWDAAAKLSKGK